MPMFQLTKPEHVQNGSRCIIAMQYNVTKCKATTTTCFDNPIGLGLTPRYARKIEILFIFLEFFGPWRKWPQMAPNRAKRIFSY